MPDPYLDANGQALDVNELLSAHMEQVMRAEKAEAAIARVRKLAERARPGISRGCTCSGDDCTGKCRRGEPMGWDLDPAEVVRALDGVE